MINAKAIRQGVISRLLGQTAAGNKVFNTKITPNILQDLPCICVYTPSQVANSLDHRNPAFNRTIDIQFEIAVAADSNANDSLDDISHAIKTTLLTDATWLEQFASVTGYSEQQQIDADGEKPLALSILTINVEMVEPLDANR